MKTDYYPILYRTWVSVGVAGASLGVSAYKAIKSGQQDKAAAKEGAALNRPFYQIPTEDIQNRNIFAQQATGGLSAAEQEYAGEQRERGLSSSLEALKETGGGPNDFAGLNKVFEDSLKSQSALDANLHRQNIEFFTKANSEIAGKKGIQFGINELQPYETKLKEIQDRRIAAQTNENNAINEGIESLTAGATGVNSYLSTHPPGGNKDKYVNLSPYSRTFGLADTGDTGGDPAANFPTIDVNSFSAGAIAGT